jgi:predicted O-methyltransferase YrrM
MKHFFQNIQGWFGFDGLYQQRVHGVESPAHFVEIGAWKGKSTAFMAVEIINSGKDIKFDVVDTWAGSVEHQNDPEIKEGTLFDVFTNNLKPVEHAFTAIRKTSIEAAKQYADASLDFVLIDASHEYEDVLADIRAWLPKIKPGGMLAGDDIGWTGVNRAVKELLPEHTSHHNIYWTYTK